MCGIAGAFARRDMMDVVGRMTDAVAHRGPDDAGLTALVSSEGDVCGAFGHRRLSILDLSSAGHQPMAAASGRHVLIFNGEIYNFLALREELERESIQFHTGTDTEVLLQGLIAHGPAFVERLRGMFAFAFWDSAARRGILVRDPFGIKPLYIVEIGGAVLFASELRSILASNLVPRVLNPAAVRSYLGTGSVTEPLSIIDGVRALRGGTLVEISVRDGRTVLGPEIVYQESPIRAGDAWTGSASEGAQHVREALQDSIGHHLISDVPLGFFLSGGIDSSALVGIASELSTTTLNTFTVTFAEEEFSEAGPARAVAQRFGTKHHEIKLSAEDLLASLPSMFSAMDQPSIDGLNTYVVSQAVRERGIKVVLSGLGGDELFGGYPSFTRARRVQRLWQLMPKLRRALMRPAAMFDDVRAQKLHVMLTGETPALGAYLASRILFSEERVNALAGAGSPAVPAEASAVLSLLQQVSWYEINGYMRNTLLRDSDNFSMAHGLELRVPYVDAGVASTAMMIDDRLKLRSGSSKPVLVAAVRDLLPTIVWDRPKQGFTLPFDRWMRRELHDEMESVFTLALAGAVGMEPAAVRHVWEDFQVRRNGVTWSRAWALYTLLRWARDNEARLAVPERVTRTRARALVEA